MKPTDPDTVTVATWTGCFGAMLFTVILWAAYGFAAAITGMLIAGCTVLWTAGLVAKADQRRSLTLFDNDGPGEDNGSVR